MATLFQQAITLAKQGDRAGAENILRQVVAEQPDNEAAWMWLSAVTGDTAIRRQALQSALEISPDNQLAQKGQARFGAAPALDFAPPQTYDFETESPPPAEAPQIEAEELEPAPSQEAAFDFDFGAGEAEFAPPADIPAQEEPVDTGFVFDFGDEEPAATADAVPAQTEVADTDFDFGAEEAPPKSEESDAPFDFGFDFGGEEPAAISGEVPTPLEEPDSGFDFEDAAETGVAAAAIGAGAASLADDDDQAVDDSPFDFSFITDDAGSTPPADTFDPVSEPKAPDLESSPSFDVGADEAPPAFGFDAPAEEDTAPPSFDFGEPDTTAAESAGDDGGFDWNLFASGGPPQFEEETAPSEMDLSARLDFADKEPFAQEEDEDQGAVIIFDEPEESEEEEEEEPDEETLRLGSLEQSKKQNKMLIAGVAFFSVVVVFCCGLYYYVAEIADIYNFIPAPPEITQAAENPRNGESTLKFSGFPAAKARVTWTADPEAKTCAGSTGLEVDFQNGDPLARFSNRVCTADGCSFDKELTPGPISKVTVKYVCGKEAEVTLFQASPGSNVE